VGEVGNPDGVGQIGDPECGDFLRITLRVEEDRIAEVKFLCHGCPAAIACASATTEVALGRHVAA
jgi:nitrogen fixation NifU-like protein